MAAPSGPHEKQRLSVVPLGMLPVNPPLVKLPATEITEVAGDLP